MVPIYEARTMRASPGTEINTVFSVINIKGNVLRVIRLDLKFHITNCYEKLMTNYLRMYEKLLDKTEKASVYKTAFMTFSSDTWQDIRISTFP